MIQYKFEFEFFLFLLKNLLFGEFYTWQFDYPNNYVLLGTLTYDVIFYLNNCSNLNFIKTENSYLKYLN